MRPRHSPGNPLAQASGIETFVATHVTWYKYIHNIQRSWWIYIHVFFTIWYLSIYLSMYVCMYVCMYTGVHVYMYVCMYVCMYVSMYVCMYACMYVCMSMYVNVCMSMYVWILGRGLVQCCYAGITHMWYARKPFGNTKGYKREYRWWKKNLRCTQPRFKKEKKTYACQPRAGFLPSTVWTCMCTHLIYLCISIHASVLLTSQGHPSFYRVINTTHKHEQSTNKSKEHQQVYIYISMYLCTNNSSNATSGYPWTTQVAHLLEVLQLSPVTDSFVSKEIPH